MCISTSSLAIYVLCCEQPQSKLALLKKTLDEVAREHGNRVRVEHLIKSVVMIVTSMKMEVINKTVSPIKLIFR
jgi:hypothetical protein